MTEEQLIWRDEFNIGVETIDREHRRLFKIISKLITYHEEGKTASGRVRRASSISKPTP